MGDRDVRLVPVTIERDEHGPLWIGQYWTHDGVPDPEALVLSNRDDALAWVREPPRGSDSAVETTEMPWFVSATYRFGGEEAYAIASLAKCIFM